MNPLRWSRGRFRIGCVQGAQGPRRRGSCAPGLARRQSDPHYDGRYITHVHPAYGGFTPGPTPGEKRAYRKENFGLRGPPYGSTAGMIVENTVPSKISAVTLNWEPEAIISNIEKAGADGTLTRLSRNPTKRPLAGIVIVLLVY